MKKTKCLVTGGAGFIGSHLVDRLLESGYAVTVIDDFSSGKKENLENHLTNPDLKIVAQNICDPDIEELFENIGIVFHLAAMPRVQFSIEFPQKTNNTNVVGTLNVLECARKTGIRRFVYSASSSAYGDQKKLPLVETMNPNPMSPYALQKLVGEYYCKLYNLLYGMETINLRYFNVYGPRQDFSGGYACLVPKSIDLVLEGKSPEIYGDGTQTRDYAYVKDIVEANLLAATTKNEKAFGQIFNVGNGDNLSVNDIVKNIIGNRSIKPEYKPPVIEPKDTLADTKKIIKMLGWQPKYTFPEGIEETIDWFQENR